MLDTHTSFSLNFSCSVSVDGAKLKGQHLITPMIESVSVKYDFMHPLLASSRAVFIETG